MLLAVASGALAFQLDLPTTHVAETDYQAVAGVLQNEAKEGDVVLLFPWWTERARLFLPTGLPVVGYLGSERDDLVDAPRVWVLAEPRLPLAGRGAFDEAFSPGRTPLGPERRFGNLSLTPYLNGRYRPSAFSGSSVLSRAEVYLEEPNGARRPCTWNGQRHECPNGNVIGLEWHEVRFRPLKCLRFNAPGGQTRLVLEVPHVPAADAVVLEAGYTGERGAHPRSIVTDSQLALEIDGAAQTLFLPAGVERLHRLERGAVAEGARLRLWLQSDNAHEREVCVMLEAFARQPR